MSDQESNIQEVGGMQKIIPSLSAGFVSGITAIILSISFAALIFTGELSGYISSGIGIMLLGAFLAAIISVVSSSFSGTINIIQDAPAVLLGAEVAAVVGVMAANQSSADPFLTAMAMIIFTTLLTSFSLFIMGIFNLGTIVRYLPFPVVGGFLAGTGWLLFKGGLSIVDVNFNFLNLGALFAEGEILRWGSVLLFGILLLIVLDRVDHFLAMPGLIFGGMLVFYAALWISGTSIGQATEAGWFFDSFPKGNIFKFISLDVAQNADWRTIFDHTANLGAVVIVSIISMLLNVNGIEFSTNKEINLKREMISVGAGNFAAGMFGSSVTYPSLSLSVLNARLGRGSRLAGLFASLLIGVVLLFGAPMLSLFPKPILGGLVLFLGLCFMRDWLVATYKKLPLIEYLLIWVILLAMSILGTLEAVGIGLLLAIILFVINYSQINMIKHTFSAKNYRSTVDRDSVYTRVLQNRGNWLRIFELQGYLFFGTVNRLLEHVREELGEDKKNEIKYMVLGFRHVTGLDASALMIFNKLVSVASEYGAQIIFVSLEDDVCKFLEAELQSDAEEKKWHIFDNLDAGVEWCEDEIVRIYQSAGLAQRTRPTTKKLTVSKERKDRLAGLMGYLEDRSTVDEEREKTLVEKLAPYMEQRTVKAGEFIIKEGARVKGLFFIQGGAARVEITDAHGNAVRLRKMQAGSVVGEMSLYGKRATTANVIADEDCEVHFLSKAKVREMEKEDVALANEMHKFLTELMGYRTASTTDTIRALLD